MKVLNDMRQRLEGFYEDWERLPGKLSGMITAKYYGLDSLFATAHLEFAKLRDDKDPDDLTPAEVDFMNRFSDLDF